MSSEPGKCYGCGHVHGPAIGDQDCAGCRAERGPKAACLGYIENEGQAAGVLGLALAKVFETKKIGPGVVAVRRRRKR